MHHEWCFFSSLEMVVDRFSEDENAEQTRKLFFVFPLNGQVP